MKRLISLLTALMLALPAGAADTPARSSGSLVIIDDRGVLVIPANRQAWHNLGFTTHSLDVSSGLRVLRDIPSPVYLLVAAQHAGWLSRAYVQNKLPATVAGVVLLGAKNTARKSFGRAQGMPPLLGA